MKKMNVGADASVRPLTQKGITLIALIITIIVMLILVGVTINVALSGGLFEKANSASKQTQKEVDKEMLLSAVVATVDKYGNYHLDQVQEHLPEGEFTYNSTTKVYKSKNGNEFTINETTGKVEEYVAPSTQSEEQEVIPQGVDDLIPTATEKGYVQPVSNAGITSYDYISSVMSYIELGSSETELEGVTYKVVSIQDSRNSNKLYMVL